jgi:tetratricopeptide (TPR) repeat protein
MSNPWEINEPTDDELWSELGDAVDARKQEIYFMLGHRTFHAQRYEAALALFEQSLELSEKLSYTREKYFSLQWMTRCHRELKNWDKVSEIFALIEGSAVPELEAEDLAQLFRSKAFAMRERRRAIDAIEAFRIAEGYAREEGDCFSACMDAIQRAKIHALLREYSTAREILESTHVYAREESILPIAAMVQYWLGKVYLESGDVGLAIPTLQDAITCLESVEDVMHVKDAKLALGTAFARAGEHSAADAILTELDADLKPWDNEVRSGILMARTEMTKDATEVSALFTKARALALNDGSYHFVNVVDINIAVVMAESGDMARAEKILDDVLVSAERFDDQDIINEARVRLASIYVETERSDQALALLETMSIATFGDDTFGWQRYALVRSAAALQVGDLDDAEETVRVIMNLDRTWANLAMIAEAYWITAQIEEHRNGRTSTWEHMLSASVALTLQAGNAELATNRSRDLVPDAPGGNRSIPRAPITSPEGLIANINEKDDRGNA